MFTEFFFTSHWSIWSWFGIVVIIASSVSIAYLEVCLNDIYRWVYDLIQNLVESDGKASTALKAEYYDALWQAFILMSVKVLLRTFLHFFARHWSFRWRHAMNDYYMKRWPYIRHMEGASQRIQEDTMRFAVIMESLGLEMVEAVFVLLLFFPVLWELSAAIEKLPWVGAVHGGLMWVALLWSVLGTVILALVGIKLPDLKYRNQVVEAAFRKELVHGEDQSDRARPETTAVLFQAVRQNYFTQFCHFLYFDAVKHTYIECGHILPYLVLGPTLLTPGTITLGQLQQIRRTFWKVEHSLHFFVQRWDQIIDLLAIAKRLREFKDTTDEVGEETLLEVGLRARGGSIEMVTIDVD